jgi:ATP-dependent DNA helicase RecG
MSRLIEGDVGSGKTFVAATVAYAVIKNRPVGQNFGNLQVAYMAPTEVLATQLFENFTKYFEHTGISIALITSSGCRKFPSKSAAWENGKQVKTWTSISKNQLLKWIKNGEIPIVIGTHSLISKTVQFEDLSLVIIDEQHRFGTNQRMKLAKKEGHSPHYLSMTATPIPRTLALTIYGDLDLSIIDEMPKGRKKVITEIIPENKRTEAYEKVKKELEIGRQLYVVCPKIDESSVKVNTSESTDIFLLENSSCSGRRPPKPLGSINLDLKTVTTEAKRLKKDIFREYNIDIMHSQMTKDKKEKTAFDIAKNETIKKYIFLRSILSYEDIIIRFINLPCSIFYLQIR